MSFLNVRAVKRKYRELSLKRRRAFPFLGRNLRARIVRAALEEADKQIVRATEELKIALEKRNALSNNLNTHKKTGNEIGAINTKVLLDKSTKNVQTLVNRLSEAFLERQLTYLIITGKTNLIKDSPKLNSRLKTRIAAAKEHPEKFDLISHYLETGEIGTTKEEQTKLRAALKRPLKSANDLYITKKSPAKIKPKDIESINTILTEI